MPGNRQKFFFCDRTERMKTQKKQLILAVSGIKNSGKTTLIIALLPALKKRNLNTAVIKHDGHEFEADIPGTDTWKAREAGACGTLVFSGTKYMMVKYHPAESTEELISLFPEADIILLEGFKHSEYPKIEVIRKANSLCSVCDPRFLQGIVTDISREELKYDAGEEVEEIPFFELDETEPLAEWICQLWKKKQSSL